MTKKILFVASVDKEHIIKFHLPYLKFFKDRGYEVHVACAGDSEIPYCDKKYKIPFERSPFKLANFYAYKLLTRILNENNYTLIHCHTPIGGVVARLAARRHFNNGTRVLYTAHGFHFYKGGPLTNWIIYYPIEKLLSKITDCLITVNSEDYQLAIRKKFKSKRIEHINGVGVNLEKYYPISEEDKNEIRIRNGFKNDDFILIYPAELTKNKNQSLLIRSVSLLKEKIPTIKLMLPGPVYEIEYFRRLAAELGVLDKIYFLGWREDINELINISDIAVAASKREGLPLNIIEAMACNKAVVASDNRGHRELVIDETSGFLVKNEYEMAKRILELYQNSELREYMGKNGRKNIAKYSLARVLDQMEDIYSLYL